MHIEFIVPERPVSGQSRRQKNIQAWRDLVAERARTALGNTPPVPPGQSIAIRVLYFYDEAMLDTDNVLKPIQDALKGVVFEDDSLVSDIEVRRRYLHTVFTLEKPSPILLSGLELKSEFVYVEVTDAPAQDVLP